MQHGRCEGGACNQPPATPLAEAWSRALPDDVDFRGVTDPSGNLYWIERLPIRVINPCALVSVTSSGVERFRVVAQNLSATTGSIATSQQPPRSPSMTSSTTTAALTQRPVPGYLFRTTT